MSYNPNVQSQTQTGSRTLSFDAGLQAHMQSVYRTMSIGLVVTGLVAFGVASSEQLFALVFNTPLKWVALLAPLAIIWFGLTPERAFRMSTARVRGIFYLLSALYGLTFSVIFVMFTGESILRVFFITAAMFGGMGLWGYTTKKDLTGLGSFLIMGLIGIIIASVVNLFFGFELVHFIVSILGVMIFTLMTAYDTQRIKETYSHGYASEDNDKMATLGALSLYLNFILLFQHMMHLVGDQR